MNLLKNLNIFFSKIDQEDLLLPEEDLLLPEEDLPLPEEAD